MLANAPCVIGFRSVQVEAIRTRSHPSGGWLVSAFFLVVPGRRGVARRARSARRSRHGVALGPAVCPRNGTTFAFDAEGEILENALTKVRPFLTRHSVDVATH